MKKLLLCCSIIIFTLYGCKDDDLSTSNSPDEGSQITIDIQNLPALSDSARYEAWLFGDKNAVAKIGVLNPASGSVNAVFDIKLVDLKKAKYVIITVEPTREDSAAAVNPSTSHILAGAIEVNNATMDVQNDFALKTNFTDAAGKYFLATLSDPLNANTKSGLWFAQMVDGKPAAGLTLPVLAAGWRYEGWVEVNGKKMSTGQFTAANQSDLAAPYSGTTPVLFPGEDFLNNAPAGLTFPLNLAGAKLSITVEPNAENYSEPFNLIVLSANIPADASASTNYDMVKSANVPSGSIVMKVKI